ncbi:MAG TPA: hypothetical protein VLL08_15035 [Kineosporiaceae bacterium]|nr:hypothetical protein [Kineosporiaceae bacterium]
MTESPRPPWSNTVQLNVVATVDVGRALRQGSVQDAVWLTDNGVGSTGIGTGHLQTACRPGQAVNWIVRSVDAARRPDGSWPPAVRMCSIVFLDAEGDAADGKVCEDFAIYGMPDKIRSPFTPVYQYWAGTVVNDLAPGLYRYRLILELDQPDGSDVVRLNAPEYPALLVAP